MPRSAIPSTSLLRAVRSYYGLQQFELAVYLGISPELVKHIEAGRRTLTGEVLLRLLPLAEPVPDEPVPPPPALTGLPAPAPGPLEARLDDCTYQAGKLRRELTRVVAEATIATRWQQALPALLAASATAWDPARTRAWVLRRPATLDAELVAQYHLLRLRIAALDTEAAALAALLAPA